jgi:hypothetical protein
VGRSSWRPLSKANASLPALNRPPDRELRARGLASLRLLDVADATIPDADVRNDEDSALPPAAGPARSHHSSSLTSLSAADLNTPAKWQWGEGDSTVRTKASHRRDAYTTAGVALIEGQRTAT